MDEHFGRYLLRELLWEMKQADISIPELQGVPQDQIELLGHEGYDTLSVQVSSQVFTAHLSWRGDVPPVITPIMPPET
jgi:hypothetical protein